MVMPGARTPYAKDLGEQHPGGLRLHCLIPICSNAGVQAPQSGHPPRGVRPPGRPALHGRS
jgi:hypothetical protein